MFKIYIYIYIGFCDSYFENYADGWLKKFGVP